MKNFIGKIHITNFKSIKDCSIENCRRINLFIGRPNVGKTNIIEALSIFSIPFLKENSSKKLSNLIRIENEGELFYNGDTSRDATIRTNIGKCAVGYHPKEGLKAEVDFFGDSYDDIKIDEKLNVKGIYNPQNFEPPVKRYNFKTEVIFKKSHAKYLIPPYGYNLFSIIENYPELKSEVRSLFKEYGLDIVFEKGSQSMKIIQPGNKEFFIVPYNSTADTLQRIIFFKTAIFSNSDSVILFEESAANSFPPFMTHITQEMIFKKDNQYFLTTHSPFILSDLIENVREELAVFIVNYENHETKLRQLSREELHDVFRNGIDLFTNSESFV